VYLAAYLRRAFTWRRFAVYVSHFKILIITTEIIFKKIKNKFGRVIKRVYICVIKNKTKNKTP